MTIGYAHVPNTYPLDLCQGEHFTRYPGYSTIHPYPNLIGQIQPFMPQINQMSVQSVSYVGWGVDPERTVESMSMLGYPILPIDPSVGGENGV